MRTITKVFIILELMDCFTTFLGFTYLKNVWELNSFINTLGWELLLFLKFLVCLYVIWFLEKRSKNKIAETFIMIIPVVIPIWNIIEFVFTKIVRG
jgi:uncharacterized membrane protein